MPSDDNNNMSEEIEALVAMLRQEIGKIEDVAEEIKAIASQTNLLALTQPLRRLVPVKPERGLRSLPGKSKLCPGKQLKQLKM